MADARLLRRLELVAGRLSRLRAVKIRTIGWLLLAAWILTLLLVSRTDWLVTSLVVGAPIVVLLGLLAGRTGPRDRQAAALLIERAFPELDSRLLTAIQQQPSSHQWDFTFLQAELISEVFSQLRRQEWSRAVPRRRVWLSRIAHLASLAACAALIALALSRPLPSGAPGGGLSDPTGRLGAPYRVAVEPGDVELERGTSLVVVARFGDRLPATVELVATDGQANEIRVPLRKSLDDPLFGGRIADVEKDLTYHVEFDGRRSDDYRVTTFVYPDLLRADVRVRFPHYTELAPKTLEDVRRFSVVEGSSLDLLCLVNKPVQSARLVDQNDRQLTLTPDQEDSTKLSANWSADELGERRMQLELTDAQGRRNRDRTEFRITVLPNRPPDLRVTFPSQDLRVSSLQEVALNAEASDDFGLKNVGLVYETPDGQQETVEFSKQTSPEERTTAEHLLALESIDVHPDELISYYFFAEDVGPDGRPRRSFSDIFFAEVRPFEEIFRQAAAQARQQQQQQQRQGGAGQLIELQRQIVTAAWNVIRRENRTPVSDAFVPDVRTLDESQRQVRELTVQASDELQDAVMKRFADEAIEYMAKAAQQFELAVSELSVAKVSEARSAAQQAYRALLHLQSREMNVQNQQGGGGGRSAQERMNQQLNALRLKNDRDRYETERQAAQQQDQANRESLQVMNRLKELARRQEDLNERIRELENALRNAQTEDEKAEIQRRLKRLQEEQQELLRNLDELRERMNREPNRERMADARQQTDAARERVLRASEALQEGQTSRALTEGTRAERQLQQLREDFRRQNAGQFDDAVRELRQDVRELADEQQKLADQLADPAGAQSGERPSLRESPRNPREEIAGGLDQQKKRLGEVLDKTRGLVEESEDSEPLLSKKLYDAIRNLREHQPEEALQNAAKMMRFGIAGEARKFEEQARKGIGQLQSGIEDAARSILGNEEEALRLAQTELDQLTDAIRQELEQNNFSDQSTPQQGTPRQPVTSEEDSNNRQSDQQPAADRQQGQRNGEQGQIDDAQDGKRSGDQSGESPNGQQPGRNPSESQQQQGRQPDSQSGSQSQGGDQQAQSGSRRGERSNRAGNRSADSLAESLGEFFNQGGDRDSGGTSGPHAPLTGGDFLDWSDRMRNLEEMLTTPQLRAQAATIRERARQERMEVKRHSKQPNWELVRTSIYGPMLELEKLIAEELARRDPNRQLVPIDRDPVPEKYADLVRNYYEQLSRQRSSDRR